MSLTLHESLPGHHLQGSYTLEQKDWPLFRKVMEDRIYCQVPVYCVLTGLLDGEAAGLAFLLEVHGGQDLQSCKS